MLMALKGKHEHHKKTSNNNYLDYEIYAEYHFLGSGNQEISDNQGPRLSSFQFILKALVMLRLHGAVGVGVFNSLLQF